MKKVLFISLLTSAVGFAAPGALADNQRGFYAGLGGGLVEFDDGSVFDDSGARFRMLELLGGYKYNSALGIELRAGTGIGDRDASIEAGDVSVDYELSLDRFESIYYRPELANPEAKLYGLLGYSQLRRSSDAVGVDLGDDTESGLSYGVGVGFVVNPSVNLNFEYKRLLDKSDFEIDSGTINFDYRF
jgi:opacity protein-like surface antigen